MCFHPVNEPSVNWRSSSVLDVFAESPGCNGNCGDWWLAQQWPSQLGWQHCTHLWPTLSNHLMHSGIVGTARRVCFGAMLPRCQVIYLFTIPLWHPLVMAIASLQPHHFVWHSICSLGEDSRSFRCVKVGARVFCEWQVGAVQWEG